MDKKIKIEFSTIFLTGLIYLSLRFLNEYNIITKIFMNEILVIILPIIYLLGFLLVKGILDEEIKKLGKEKENLQNILFEIEKNKTKELENKKNKLEKDLIQIDSEIINIEKIKNDK